jgi:hypothetical protein
MRTPLEIIADYGVSTTSYIQAIQQFNNIDHPIVMEKSQYEESINEIIGGDTPPTFSSDKEARIYFLYVVQETIRAFGQGIIPDMADVWVEAQRRAKIMIQEQPWAIKEYNTETTGEPKLDAAGNPKKRKGAKKVEAEALYKRMNDGQNDRNAIIDALIADVGLSKPGATTYFHNLKKQFGYAGPEPVKKKAKKKLSAPSTPKSTKKVIRPSKSEQARRIYTDLRGRPKEEVIAQIIKQTGTSPGGANTYYCSCKKELGE